MHVADVNTTGRKPRSISATLRRHAPTRLLLRHLWWNVLLSPAWPRTPNREFARVIFVCLGNVCRSPYAEARARRLGIEALSCGLAVDESVPPPPTAVEVAARRGVDLSAHRSRSIDEMDLSPRDLVLVMEPPMLAAARDRLQAGAAVALLGISSRNGPAMPYIPDPHGLTEAMFTAVYDIVDRCVLGLRGPH